MEWILLYSYIFVCRLVSLVAGNNVILPTFSWDPRNECFNKSVGKSDSKGYYAHLNVDQDSQIYFICPSAVITYNVLNNYVSKSNMFENMHMCTKEEFHNCKLGNKTDRTRLVMNCDSPLETRQLKYMHFSFGMFKKSVDDFGFNSGEIYYFIATSNGTKESLQNRKEGRCKTHNMRLAISICEYGKNCHKLNKKCDSSVQEEPANKIPSTQGRNSQQTLDTKKQIESEDTTKLLGPEVDLDDPETQEQKSPGKDDSIWENKTFMLYVIVAPICGFFLGLFLTSCICMLLRKRDGRKRMELEQDEIKKEGSDTGTIEETHKFRDSLPIKEEMNQKYFSSIEYRNSNEFKRLLSTTSTLSTSRYSDSDRHSVTPLGYYK